METSASPQGVLRTDRRNGGHVIAEYDDSSLLRKYIYGARVDEPVCMIDVADSNAAYYYHFDGLGSVVALSNSNGDSCQSYEYSVYGQVAASDPNFIANPYMFTGRRFDIETGLYYYRARYYNPHIGRFMQTDPVGYDAGINWYLYCGNNPVAFVDPSGLYSTTSTFALYKIFWDVYDFCDVDVNDSMDSAIATGLVWLDVLVLGENGRMDVFDLDYAWDIINPDPNAGSPGVMGDEEFWGNVHEGVGFAFGLLGVDETSAENIFWVWEATEAVIWPGNTQGRDNFEGGEEGWLEDISRGMEGYERGRRR